jgi:hypothetical protein
MLMEVTTSAQLPQCVYCGTERPADRSECPQCGRPWIDVRVGSLAETEAKVLVGAAVTTELTPIPVPLGEPPESVLTVDLTGDQHEDRDSDTDVLRWAIPTVLAVSALLVFAMFLFGLLDNNEPGAAAPASSTTPSTTVVPSSTAATTTIAPSTTPAPTTTTLPGTGSLVASGDAVPVAKLTLNADGVGPIEIGTPAPEAIGRFVASLGEPEEIAAAGPAQGLCEGETGLVVRWAALNVIVSGTLDDGTFVAYRYQEPDIPVSQLDLTTPSGIRVGDTIETLNEVYASYNISYETDGTNATFTLSDGEQLLLWGPVSSTEEGGQIQGIFSAAPCPQD